MSSQETNELPGPADASVSTEPTTPSEHEPIPTVDQLSPIPENIPNKPETVITKEQTLYYKLHYGPIFFKIVSWKKGRCYTGPTFAQNDDNQYYCFTYYDHGTRKEVTTTDHKYYIYELKSDREKIIAVIKKDYEDLKERMEQVKKKSDLTKEYRLDPTGSYSLNTAYYSNDSKEFVRCRIVDIPLMWGKITITKDTDPDTKLNVDISKIYRPTKPATRSGGRGKKTKKGGYKHKKSNRKQKYHSRTRKVRKPRNGNGRTYSKRRN